MNITLIGSGYVGLVTAACLAEIGNNILCIDIDADKIDLLNQGRVPIHEPGLLEMIARNRTAGRIHFSTDFARGVTHGTIQFIAVGTPPHEDGSADLDAVLSVAQAIGEHIEGFTLIVNKSTVPVGTAEQVRLIIADALAARSVAFPFSVVSNPEFLKEGAAIDDFMRPDRIVIGCDIDENGRRARSLLRQLYAPFNRNHDRMIEMDVRSAEFTKYAANAMLATRISFMNEMAGLAERIGVDIEVVRQGIGADPRIGYHFLYAGCGYGGSCLPKDMQALIRTACEHQQPLRILHAVEKVNDGQKQLLVEKIINRFGENLSGRHFAIWGLAFKPGTDDMRAAPSRILIAALLARGATVTAHDPVALEEAERVFALDFQHLSDCHARLKLASDQMQAVEGADALIIVTEWKAFKSPDFSCLRTQLRQPLIFDGRNLYDPAAMRALGIEYYPIGRAVERTKNDSARYRP
jgi:UDPglucose 6-dehydrogenase